jgi:hypothetical protein
VLLLSLPPLLVLLSLLLLQDLGKTDKKEDSKQQYLLLQVSRRTGAMCWPIQQYASSTSAGQAPAAAAVTVVPSNRLDCNSL